MANRNEVIRVSAAGLCRIEIDSRYLVEINKNRGNILTPIGGALEFDEVTRSLLVNELGAVIEKGNDLRLRLSVDKLGRFDHWFRKRQGRELSPVRELTEELVEEHGVCAQLIVPEDNIRFVTLVVTTAETTRKQVKGALTHYFYEVYDVVLPPEVQFAATRAAEQQDSRLRLVSRHEMEMRFANAANLPISESGATLFAA